MNGEEYDIWDNNDKQHEECGVIGYISNNKKYDVSTSIYLGLYALQHRGQESAGIATYNAGYINVKRGKGLLTRVFDADDFSALKGSVGIGHVRYSTTGSGYKQNVQPIIAHYWGGMIAISHNGNIVNSKELRDLLIDKGSIIRSSSDTELILHLVSNERRHDIEGAILNAINKLSGAYSMVLIAEEKLIGIRDPYGFRPLCLGKVDNGYVLASETSALDIMEAKFVKDIEPGEMIVIDGKDYRSIKFKKNERNALCVFEYIYFARADSVIDGISVYEVRKKMGMELAKMSKIDADIVIPVPDSGVATAIGFARQAGIPFEIGLFKNSYVGRTFIHPGKDERGAKVKIKLNPIKSVIKDKKVAVVDDSIVRGTTSKRIVKLIKNAGAKEVHMFISSPPIKHPCFFGIDTSEKKTLIASSHTVEEIRRYLEVDSLTYITIDGLSRAVGKPLDSLCYACFNGDYPVPVDEDGNTTKTILEDYKVLER